MRLAVVFLGLLLIGAPCQGQDHAPASSHEGAVLELIELLDLEAINTQSREIMIESMVVQNPVLEQYVDIFEDFFATYGSWDELLPQYVQLYREAYTEAELRELISFYQTPVGKKTVRLTPRLMREGAEIGQRQITPHLPELQRRIQERLKGGDKQ